MPMDKVHFDKNHSNEAIDEEMEENEEIDNITAEDVDLELEEDNATEKDLNETSAMNKTQCSADNKSEYSFLISDLFVFIECQQTRNLLCFEAATENR